MQELIRTNDLVLISYVESLLRAAGFAAVVLDGHSSAVDGSLGLLPRRIMVDSEDAPAARRLLAEAGLGHELRPAPRVGPR
ncbi:DUF2007 domain-containing protein [Zavarzinia compransoris]|uniref:DUF2007 domain-containing protein n=1 Tax=Zavarzinia compransoris TaxID=1264899 RepID=A0A317E5C2_9PROT|nr:DUF2007 domain-containing protein [Zavarzinia compransoris]PWR20593.1 hypothetical protein DKG75_11330 [Zavarzinia compransoris]TDP43761.1 putative signal transducing protein [Zavarzinia compransoris]